MMGYYLANFLKSLDRIRVESNYCLVLLPVIEDLQETEKAFEDMEKALCNLKKEYRKRITALRKPQDCDLDNPVLKRCEKCPNIGASLDAHPVCKLTLRALD